MKVATRGKKIWQKITLFWGSFFSHSLVAVASSTSSSSLHLFGQLIEVVSIVVACRKSSMHSSPEWLTAKLPLSGKYRVYHHKSTLSIITQQKVLEKKGTAHEKLKEWKKVFSNTWKRKLLHLFDCCKAPKNASIFRVSYTVKKF